MGTRGKPSSRHIGDLTENGVAPVANGAGAAMRVTGKALRATIFIDDDDTWQHKPLYHEIVHRAKAAGLAGASVFRGVEGFGTSSLIHTTRLLSLAQDLPMVIVLVDTPDRVRGFLPQLDELICEGLVTIDEVEAIQYVRSSSTSQGATA